MDENVSEFLAMCGMALLFVVAISYAFISYNSLSERAELFTDSNPITKRSEATKEDLSGTSIEREATRAEVIMAVAGIGRLNSSNQRNDFTVEFKCSGTTYTCRYDATNSLIVINGVREYNPDTEVSGLIAKLKTLIPEGTTFGVSYTNDAIIYE